jgi:3-oxoacyl-[acyl-carrier-protein] synthase II
MPTPPEVVITGLGVVSPIGIGREAFWSALLAGTSGIDSLAEFQPSDLPFRFGARVRGFDAKQYVQPRKTIKVMCVEIQQAYAAAQLAMQDAGLAKGTINPDRLGVVLGSEMLFGELPEVQDVIRGCIEDGQFVFDRWGVQAFKDQYPLWMLKYLPNMAACHISIALDARGPNNSIVQGGASSLLAVVEAVKVIERGQADAMLTGGSGSLVATSCLPFRGWEHLSKWNGTPAGASRPFDAQRSGIVPGEGAATLVLETRASAEKRGATILARIAGTARTFEAPRPGQAITGSAIERSITGALAAASLTAADVGHVNANGDGSVAADAVEAQAIHRVLGNVPVTAPKSYFGDLGAGSGAVELLASVLASADGRVPPTLNYDTPDPACPVNVIRGQPLATENRVGVVLSQSNTGQAAAVVVCAP